MLHAAQQMNALIKYMNNNGDAKDGKHEAIDGWMWWAWNANSGDTGGLVSPRLHTHALAMGKPPGQSQMLHLQPHVLHQYPVTH